MRPRCVPLPYLPLLLPPPPPVPLPRLSLYCRSGAYETSFGVGRRLSVCLDSADAEQESRAAQRVVPLSLSLPPTPPPPLVFRNIAARCRRSVALSRQ
jgi:hypothetical protein